MSDEEVKIHSAFLDNFSGYQFSGVEINYTNNSLTLNYNEKDKKYIENLLLKLYDQPSMIIIFRCQGKNVSFTSKEMSYTDLFYLVKTNMDSVKFSSMQEDHLKFNDELKSIYDLFEKTITKNVDLTIGIHNVDGDRQFKLVSNNYSVQEAFKRVGLSVKENACYFRKSKFNNVTQVFESIKNNPLVYYYQPNNIARSGFAGFSNIGFSLAIDILAIVTGIVLLTH